LALWPHRPGWGTTASSGNPDPAPACVEEHPAHPGRSPVQRLHRIRLAWTGSGDDAHHLPPRALSPPHATSPAGSIKTSFTPHAEPQPRPASPVLFISYYITPRYFRPEIHLAPFIQTVPQPSANALAWSSTSHFAFTALHAPVPLPFLCPAQISRPEVHLPSFPLGVGFTLFVHTVLTPASPRCSRLEVHTILSRGEDWLHTFVHTLFTPPLPAGAPVWRFTWLTNPARV
jgi:hypothetical protein